MNSKRVLSTIIIAALVVTAQGNHVSAAEDIPEPGYVYYNGEKYATGLVIPDNPISVKNPSDLCSADGIDALFGEDLPSKFIPTDLPPLRNQNPYGTCWSFASTAAAEMSVIRHGIMSNPDFSELHALYFSQNHVNDPLGGTAGEVPKSLNTFIRGNGVLTAARSFSCWKGPVDESYAPYDMIPEVKDTGLNNGIAYESDVHLQDFYEISLTDEIETENHEFIEFAANEDGIREGKRLISENGAITIGFYAKSGTSAETDDATYSEENNCYYNPEAFNGESHAVVAVGWDDTFSRAKFPGAQKPAKDGAWLIRNSWTTGDYEHNQDYAGYFWLSYYDKSISGVSYSFVLEDSDNYDNNYQYDAGPYINQIFIDIPKNDKDANNTAKGEYSVKEANVFKALAQDGYYGESLKAAAFYCTEPETEYTISVYTGLTDADDPESGTLKSTTTGITRYAGYHTIPLDSAVTLSRNEVFSIVVTLCIKDRDSKTITGFEGGDVGAEKGTSYMYDPQNNCWDDFCLRQGANLIIKGFTDNIIPDVSVSPEEIRFKNITDDSLKLGVSQKFSIQAEVLPENSTNKKLIWDSTNTNVAVVRNGNIEAVGIGETVITARAELGGVSASVKLVVEKGLVGIVINENQTEIGCGSSLTFTILKIPQNAEVSDEVTWTSSNPEIISIDNTGMAEGKSPGQAVITAMLSGKSVSKELTCVPGDPLLTATADADSVVTISWTPTGTPDSFVLSSEKIKTEPECIPGKTQYTYIDETYKNTSKVQMITYYLQITEKDIHKTYSANVYVGPAHRITYVVGEHGRENPDKQEFYREGEEVYLKPAIPDAKYWFHGWFYDQDQTKAVIYLKDNKDITVYAGFTLGKYYIDYDPNGAKYDMSSDVVIFDEEFRLHPNKFIYEGRNFIGWNTKKDGSGDAYSDEAVVKNLAETAYEHVTLYAQWDGEDKKSVSILVAPVGNNNLTTTGELQELITPGQCEGGVLKYRIGAEGEYSTEIPKAKDAGTYTVYYKVFGEEGYEDSEEYSVEVAIEEPAPVQEEENKHIVKFYDGEELIYSEEVSDGVMVHSIPTASRDGQTFTGWYLNGILWDPSSPVTEDITLYAQFQSPSDIKEKSALDSEMINAKTTDIYAVTGQTFSLEEGVTWKSNNTGIASISKKTLVKTKNTGYTTLVSVGQNAGSRDLYVVSPVMSVKTFTLLPGESASAELTGFILNNKNLKDHYPVYWTSSNIEVACVENGRICALSKGTATITAYVNGKSYTCKVKVIDADSKAANNLVMTLMPLQAATIRNQGFTVKDPFWESDLGMEPVQNNKGKTIHYCDPVVMITTAGKITAIGTGSDTITGRDKKGRTVTLKVTVNPPVTRIIHLNTGASKTLKLYNVKKTNGVMPVWYVTGDGNVGVNITTDGKITGTFPGMATVICTFNPYNTVGFEYKTIIYVENPAPETDGRLIAGKGTLKYTINMPVGSTYVINHPNVYQPVLYKSNKNNIAFVNEAGVIEARSKGKATLTTKINGKKVTINVTVQ